MLPKPDLCRGCIGYPWYDGQGFTLNEGDGHIPLLVTAEAPGEWEAEESRPLSPNGASGKVFRRALRENGVLSRDITISNVLRCRPPSNELRGLPYEREAIDHCSRHFANTLRESQPKVILALGDITFRELVPDRPGAVTAMRGFLFDSKYPRVKVVPTYHPAFIARGAWQLYGAFKSDIAFAVKCAREGIPTPMEVKYELDPSVSRVREYLSHLRANPNLFISYDVETPSILGETEAEDWSAKKIIQIQFSHRAGYAIVLPYVGEYRLLAHAFLALSNPKWSWNGRLSDDKALQADGAILNGELHDGMNALGHLQPSWWGKGTDNDTDKGVPSRLMGLQSATSFYCPTQFPWKHLAADPTNLRYYGAIDADMTFRCVLGILRDLESFGLMDGYRSHKLDLRPVLDYLGEVGLPVDRERQADLRTYVQGELKSLQTRIQKQVPSEILSRHPKDGWKGIPASIATIDGKAMRLKDAIVELDAIGIGADAPYVVLGDPSKERKSKPVEGYLRQGLFREPVTVETDAQGRTSATTNYVTRWYVERLYNPHGSSPNTKSYIRLMGYRMPTRIDDPTAETTGKSELKKLADETGDEVLALTYQWRELAKTGLDYTGGAWVPGDDGRVHATFKWGTASAQLVAVHPAVMTYPEHSEIAKMAKAAIRAEPGHMLVKVDMRGFHSRMIGWLANDPAYYKLADFDVHSFITAHFLKLHDAPYLLEMDDDELRGALNVIKREHQHTRNFKVKRTVHGRQFNMGVNKLYNMHAQNFDPPITEMPGLLGETRWYGMDRIKQMEAMARVGRQEAKTLFGLFDHLFPRTFVVYPEQVANQLRNETPWRLRSPFGHHRFFWDYDKEQSTAFGPSNCSHCHIQAALVRLYRSGALERFEACNMTHDALWLHPETRLVEECIRTVQYEFEAPSEILVDSPLGPFQCNSDAEVGEDLAHMTGWKGH